MGSKLTAMFLAALSVIVGLGCFAVISMAEIADAARSVGHISVPAIETLRDLSDAMNSHRQAQATFLLSSEDERADAARDIKATSQRIQVVFGQLAVSEQTSHELEYIADLKREWSTYSAATKNLTIKVGEHTNLVDGFMADSNSDFLRTKRALSRVVAEEFGDSARALTHVEATTRKAVPVTVCACILGSLICFAATILVRRFISLPLRSVTATIADLASGKRDVFVPVTRRGDEIGALSRAVHVFNVALTKADGLTLDKEKARHLDEQRSALAKQLTRDFRASMAEVLQDLACASGRMTTAATRMQDDSALTQDRAAFAVGQAQNIELNLSGIAASTDQMSANVSDIGCQLTRAATDTQAAVIISNSAMSRIDDLASSAGRVRGMVRTISKIAAQTNLLALNASIEAARAGAAGAGFAIVAQEVKALASQTERATVEISSQIDGMNEAVADTILSIKEVAGTIEAVNLSAGGISTSVQQQSAATAEIAVNARRVTTATLHSTAAIGEVLTVAENVSRRSQDVATAAHDLVRIADNIQSGLSRFFDEFWRGESVEREALSAGAPVEIWGHA